MNEIGGYFELELPKGQTNFIHSDCFFTNSGRHALEYIIRSLGNRIQKILIPYYTCDAVLQPIKRCKIDYEFYHVGSDLEIDGDIPLNDGEYIVANNYFGIKDEYIKRLINKYGSRLIVDNSQAWYAEESSACSVFYSPRKFFGLPDGGAAYCPNQTNEPLKFGLSSHRCSHLLKRIENSASAGYSDFRLNSETLTDEPITQMSKLTYRILSSIDFERARIIRRTNYQFLHDSIGKSNMLTLPHLDSFECPMVYPFLTEDKTLRKKLIDNNIFVATYWPNVNDWCEHGSTERYLTEHLIPLPIDQRYSIEEMNEILRILNSI